MIRAVCTLGCRDAAPYCSGNQRCYISTGQLNLLLRPVTTWFKWAILLTTSHATTRLGASSVLRQLCWATATSRRAEACWSEGW